LACRREEHAVMSDLLAARLQMAISLGFHIVFAAIGMVMPFLMAVSHWKWLRTKDPVYLHLTKTWSKGVAIFFATGAVSGTALSFELGLLWPKFMEHAGPIIGMPFSLEGTAFFLEAIALGIFLYGWDRIPPWTHWASGVLVGVTGVASAFFVICANGWMNAPTGFDWVDGQAQNVDPWAAMFNAAAWPQGLHMAIAAFTAVGFAVAGMHAIALLRKPQSDFHTKGCAIALVIGSVAALVHPLQGDRLAKRVADLQPAKLAAMESLHETTSGAPLRLLGLEFPKLLSFLAHGDFDATVAGLDQVPRDEWPPVTITHIAFQVMIVIGVFLMGLGALSLFVLWKKKAWLEKKPFLYLLVCALPLGFIAIEAGWTVTEVGRQPWIIQGIMKTRDAVTPMPGLVVPMLLFTALYLFLAFVVGWLLWRQFRHAR
jgi:cytochrome d ubiquinol oxidase subunit I